MQVMMVDLYDRYLNYDVFYTDEDYSLLPLDSSTLTPLSYLLTVVVE